MTAGNGDLKSLDSQERKFICMVVRNRVIRTEGEESLHIEGKPMENLGGKIKMDDQQQKRDTVKNRCERDLRSSPTQQDRPGFITRRERSVFSRWLFLLTVFCLAPVDVTCSDMFTSGEYIRTFQGIKLGLA
ncbi:hypothetical protein PoB_002164600 [Plakobranchus ocellatus]|uniref:Uncharacterized protein n=1 Tax=Plakobranchus ocellatus TaxID=259542 RepID=A0AAV3ZKT2_9GAST|nr:hypothetical protein PoB_002164600 [Plakobranchus ocellatus]